MTPTDRPPAQARDDEGRLLVVGTRFLTDLSHWIETDRSAALRLTRLMIEIGRDPFTGIGKPEPLKHRLRGYWSRRITEEDRLIYSVDANYIEFISARYHYQ